MTLRDAAPYEFATEHVDCQAQRFASVEVVRQHPADPLSDNAMKPWPGSHRNVHVWWELANGYAVGWNENPSRGWSFPVVKMR